VPLGNEICPASKIRWKGFDIGSYLLMQLATSCIPGQRLKGREIIDVESVKAESKHRDALLSKFVLGEIT
jgi:hypothetical protein